VLATNPTVEGEATAHYLSELVHTRGIRATRIAYGVPVGGELEFTDRSTIARAITGDRAAFEEIVLLHERRVLTLALRLLGTSEDAQDAAQEVFLRAFKYLRRFDTSKPLEPWLVRMTVNVCRNAGGKRSRNRSMLMPVEGVQQADPAKSPYAHLRAPAR